MRHWQHRAACVGKSDLFFDRSKLAEAQKICATCPVATKCEEHAFGATAGIWAGVDRTATYAGPSLTTPYLAQGHGTTAGYARHHARGEDPCPACKTANARAEEGRQLARRSA